MKKRFGLKIDAPITKLVSEPTVAFLSGEGMAIALFAGLWVVLP